MARKNLFDKIKATLGEGAEITGTWLRGITRKARYEWKVSFDAFHQNMQRFLKTQGVKLRKDNRKFFDDFWKTAT